MIVAHQTKALFRTGGLDRQPARLMYKLSAYGAGYQVGKMQAMGGVMAPVPEDV